MILMVLLLGVAATTGAAALIIRAAAFRHHPWSDVATRRLAWAGLAWTILAGGVLLLAPTVSSTVSVSSSGPTSAGASTHTVTATSTETLLEHEGASVVVVLLVPVAVALVGALGDGSAARRRRIASGWVLAGACLIGAASLGFFFLPAALALLAAGLKTRAGYRAVQPPSTTIV